MLEDVVSGDFTDDDWLLIIEDDGPRRLGRVLGYMVFSSEDAARRHQRLDIMCEACGLFTEGEEIPQDVTLEVMTYGDFISSYGNRMPLYNRAPTR